MTPVEICFWIAAAAVVYPYALYPVLAWALARLRNRPIQATMPVPRSVSVVVAAFNEEENIARRLDEMTALLTAAELDAEVIFVTDGSTDATAAVACSHPSPMVRVVELPARVGKAAALSEGCAVAVNEILVFADVRQSWSVDALPRMLSNFMDPTVGAVSGDLIVHRSAGVLGGVSLYWRFEKWLRRQESRFWSGVGATGAISAVRRELFRPIPCGTILDDVYWPMQVALLGYRVVHEDRAHAFDCLPDCTRDEFRRKVRTLSGCLQLTARLPAVLSPWRNPVWLQFVSHKLLRLLAPWGLLVLLVTSLLAPGPFYRTVFACQAVCYLAALLGLGTPAGRWRPFAAAASFLILNCAAWVALWVWAAGRTEGAWVKVKYKSQGSGVRGQGSVNTRPPGSGNPASVVLTPGP
jgi:cellulose synthase/poly-beta-1,6-N-acetylglucosamine synthase-like glycosyltransferase